METMLFIHLLQSPPNGFPPPRHHLQAKQPRESPIFLRYMMTDRKSGTLFPANRDLVLHDQLSNVFESDWRLMQFHATRFGDGVDQIRGGHRLSNAVFPASAFHQVVEQQCDHVVGLQECSVRIDYPKAISI